MKILRIIVVISFAILMTTCDLSRPKYTKEQLFKAQALQDTLETFIADVGAIGNSFGAPTLINILFINNNVEDTLVVNETRTKDTLIYISADIVIHSAPPGKMKNVVKGACLVNNRIIVLSYRGFNSLTEIVNEDLLTMSQKEYDYSYSNYSLEQKLLFNSFEYYPYSIRSYIFRGSDSLIVTGRSIGKTERYH